MTCFCVIINAPLQSRCSRNISLLQSSAVNYITITVIRAHYSTETAVCPKYRYLRRVLRHYQSFYFAKKCRLSFPWECYVSEWLRPTVILAVGELRPLHRYRFPKFWLQKRETSRSRAAGVAARATGCGRKLRWTVPRWPWSAAAARRRWKSWRSAIIEPRPAILLYSGYTKPAVTIAMIRSGQLPTSAFSSLTKHFWP